MKILWMSNHPATSSGYGVQTNLFTSRIRDAGHDVAILAFYGIEGHISYWDGMTVYPTDFTRWGKHSLPDYVKHFAGDTDPADVLVLTLCDVWPFTDGRMGPPGRVKGLRMASWVPVDHDPPPPNVLQALEFMNTTPIAMSRFGQEALRDVGVDALYVPHAVDTTVYRPVRNRVEVKKAMGIPEHAFVVGMVANNQGKSPPRKAFPQLFQAFAEFRRRHENAFLYVHTDVFGKHDGVNLFQLAQASGIPDGAWAAPSEYDLQMGVSAEVMSHVYSVMDVLANPSYGEGFGIPIIEAAACGTPCIVTDWTAMPELCGAGWKVQGDRWYDAAHGSYFMCPAVFEIIDALEAAYAGAHELREQAVAFAQQYDADRVMEQHWLPVLAELETRRPGEVGPLANGNRAQRRAAKKRVNA